MDKLSKREEEVLELVAHGLSVDEIAGIFFRSTETVKRTIQNIKLKLSMQKATELTAFYWCRVFGDSFEERRSRILSTSFLIVFMLVNPLSANAIRRVRRPMCRSKYRIEVSYKVEAD